MKKEITPGARTFLVYAHATLSAASSYTIISTRKMYHKPGTSRQKWRTDISRTLSLGEKIRGFQSIQNVQTLTICSTRVREIIAIGYGAI